MSIRYAPPLLVFCLLGLISGCTHLQLQKDSIHEAATVGDLQVQEVMDNLAMFVYDFNSTPFFSYPVAGTAIVTDQGNASIVGGFGRPITSGASFVTATKPPFTFTPPFFGEFLFNALTLNGGAQRSCQDAFTLTPINDPRKLELMRCAYQTALSNCGFGPVPRSCPDCQARFNKFYTGDPNGKISQKTDGTITSECLKGECWLHVGCKKDVPKKCCGVYVGHYCNTYVWVCPDGRDELTKLTLAILDYAVNNSPPQLTKDVTYYVDSLGLPTSQKDAVGVVKATVGITERNEALLNLPTSQEVELEQQLQDRIKRLSAELDQAKDEQRKILLDDIEDARQKLYFLDQQLRYGGLKEQFGPAGSAAAPLSSILLFNQVLNANTASPTLQTPSQ